MKPANLGIISLLQMGEGESSSEQFALGYLLTSCPEEKFRPINFLLYSSSSVWETSSKLITAGTPPASAILQCQKYEASPGSYITQATAANF